MGTNALSIVNGVAGTISADQPTRLEIDVNGAGLENRGELTVLAGCELRLVDTLRQTSGVTRIGGLLRCVFGDLSVEGGRVVGDGVVTGGDLINSGGVVEPGLDIGELLVVGDYDQGGGGELRVELAGYIPGVEHDVLTLDGMATLSGTLRFAFAGGFEPAEGTAFTVLTADDVVGEFDSVVGPAQSTVLYGLHTVTLVVGDAVPSGDCDGDGDIDLDDFTVFESCVTGSGNGPVPPECACADLDGDQDVDIVDWGRLQASFE
jgi:hypothetical protein